MQGGRRSIVKGARLSIQKLFVLALFVAAQPVAAATSVGVSIGSSSFELDFMYRDYGATEPRVVERGVACVGEVDYVVALHIARAAGIDVQIVVDRRRSGMSWDAVTRSCRLGADIYYVELEPAVAAGPPYGRAYGYWRKHPGADQRLSDDEIRELVLVKGLSRHCGTTPSRIAERRKAGESPAAIGNGRGRRNSEDAAPRAPGRHGKPEKGRRK
jgi:hypothetical protein